MISPCFNIILLLNHPSWESVEVPERYLWISFEQEYLVVTWLVSYDFLRWLSDYNDWWRDRDHLRWEIKFVHISIILYSFKLFNIKRRCEALLRHSISHEWTWNCGLSHHGPHPEEKEHRQAWDLFWELWCTSDYEQDREVDKEHWRGDKEGCRDPEEAARKFYLKIHFKVKLDQGTSPATVASSIDQEYIQEWPKCRWWVESLGSS